MKYIEELKSKKILTKEDINKIRDRIDELYPDVEKSERAKFLAQAIKNQYLKYIDFFPDKHKNIIFEDMLVKITKDRFEHSTTYDIFESFVDKNDLDNETLKILKNWTNNIVAEKVEEVDLYSHPNIKEKIILKIDNGKKSNEKISFLKKVNDLWNSLIQFKLNIKINRTRKFGYRKYIFEIILMILIVLSILSIVGVVDVPIKAKNTFTYTDEQNIRNLKNEKIFKLPNDFYNKIENNENDFLFNDFSDKELKNFLESKNSILVNDQYYDTIMFASRMADVDPLILFAIIGQEQGFVPKDEQYAALIINNPYNVFGSWKDYNTNFADSTYIAIRTIYPIIKVRNINQDVFVQINKTYAEDTNWHKGVAYFYNLFNNTFR